MSGLSIVCDMCGEEVQVTLSTPIHITEGEHTVEVITRRCYVLPDGVTTAHDIFLNVRWD
jgi:hypothetical protein